MSEPVDSPKGPVSAPSGPPFAPPPEKTWTRAKMRVLWGFLATFLVLLIVFRQVLFPFLMAMFTAYLVEPVISWVSRGKRLGLRWGRGPTLVLMYVIVLVGGFLLVSCGVQKIGTAVQRTIVKLKSELEVTNAAVEFDVTKPAPSNVYIPAGTELALDRAVGPSARFKTAFGAQIDEGLTSIRVLLDPIDGATIPTVAELDTPFWVVDRPSLSLPNGVDLVAKVDDTAKGLEVMLDRRVIAPVVAQIEKITGEHSDPALVRNYISEQSRNSELPNKLIGWGQITIFRVLGSMYEVILILMLTAFIVIDRRRISDFFASLPPPERRDDYLKLVSYVDRGLAGVIRGQLLICVVNGFLTWVGLQIYGIPYAVPLALIAGVFSLIPVFGTIASSIPIVLVAFATGGVGAGLFALAWISAIHLLEANLFNPLIMGTNAEMHPVLIIFALLAGEHTFGVWGALLAVPTASIIQSCFKYYRHEVVGIPRETPHGHGTWLTSVVGRLRGRRPGSTVDSSKGTPP